MLAICGDSFGYGTEQNTWPKILADKLNMSLLNLSLVAGSNYSICFQLQHILDNYEPEIIIILLTSADRFEEDLDEFEKPATIEDFIGSPYTKIGKRYLDLKFNTFKLLNN